MYLDGLRLSLMYLTQTLEYWNIFQSLDESLHHFLNENKNSFFFSHFLLQKSSLILLPSNLLWLFFTIIFKIGNDSWEEILCVTVIYNIFFTWDGPYKHEEEVYYVCSCTDIWVFPLTNCEREDSYIWVYFFQIWDSSHVRIEIEVTNLHHSKYRLVEPKPLKAWSCSKMFTSLSFPRDFRILPFKRKCL